MKMKNLLLALVLSVFGLLVKAQNGLENIYVERYYVTDATDAANSHPPLPAGSVTYRIFADMLPGYKVQSIFGSPAHTLLMNTTTSFFNNSDEGLSIPTFNATKAKKNTVMIDSWLSTGGACGGYLGIPKAEDNGVGNFVNSNVPMLLQNNAAQAGIPLSIQDGMFAGAVPATITLGIDQAMLDVFGDGTVVGNSFSLTNGAWSCLAGAAGPIPESNKVLIAQITTDGIFHFELNIQIGTPSGGTENYVSSNPTGVEMTIPSLIQTFLPVPAPPTVSIMAPLNNSTFLIGNPVDITATAADIDGTVSQVEFFVDDISIGIDFTVPYSAAYTGLIAASHVLTAKATDNDGQLTVSDPVNFSISNAAPTSFAVTGGGAYCQGTAGLPVGLAGSENGVTYTLYKNSIAQVPTVTGTGAALTFGNQIAGTYTVNGTDGVVTTPMTGNAIITETPSPLPTITGPATPCVMSAGNAYATQSGMSNYQWTISSGGTITGGGGTEAITATWNTAGNQAVNVIYTSALGCTAVDPAIFDVSVSAQPASAGTITGTPSVCEGSQEVIYSVPFITNAVTYNWSLPEGASIATGANTNAITVNYAASAVSGIIKVNGVNDCGSGESSPDYNVVVSPVPSTPAITQHGDTLVSSAVTGNQWYLDGVAIAGATGKDHVAQYNGNYTVVVTLNGCNSVPSNSILILNVSISDIAIDKTFGIYPNPSPGLFDVKVQSSKKMQCTIEIYNSLGSLIFKQNDILIDGTFIKHIDLTGAPAGAYVVVLRSHNNNLFRKVVLIK